MVKSNLRNLPQQKTGEIPSYSVKESQRAKHVNIKVLANGELQVIIPQGFDRTRIPEILHRKQRWIEKTVSRVKECQSAVQLQKMPPSEIFLPVLGQHWQVEYQFTAMQGVTAIEKQHQKVIVVRGSITQHDLCREVLRRWLTHQAYKCLVPWLKEVSRTCQLPFDKATIRGQKTLWASCSQDRSISLNYKLLFLPNRLVNYVFVHELCHTIHLNHSSAFWNLVGAKLPEYKQLDTELRTAMSYVPGWVGKD